VERGVFGQYGDLGLGSSGDLGEANKPVGTIEGRGFLLAQFGIFDLRVLGCETIEHDAIGGHAELVLPIDAEQRHPAGRDCVDAL
jgi:hypothetical protein